MKTIIFSIASYMAFGAKWHKSRMGNCHNNTPKVHYNKALMYPEQLLPYIEQYCGHYEEFASEMVEEYGGEDQQINYTEFDILAEYLNLELEEGAKQLVFKEIANNDGGISKEDMTQFVQEVADANGITCEEREGQTLA